MLVQHGDQLRVGDLDLFFCIQGATPGHAEIKPLRKTKLKWLLQVPADEKLLLPDRATGVHDHGETDGKNEGRRRRSFPEGNQSPALSAGQYLKDVIRAPRG
jgi:hypothetical protein